jgi:DNA-binding NarL/FixJ family response regulator
MSTGPKAIRVLTVDDHALLGEGIAALVNGEPDMRIVAVAASGQQAIEQFRLHRPDVTLMDLQMPGLNGVEAIISIRSEFSDARIIVLTAYTGDVQRLRALEAGARAYVLKGRVHRELFDTIRAVYAGQKRMPPEVAAELADHAADDDFDHTRDRRAPISCEGEREQGDRR